MNTLGERLGQLERQLAHFDLESDTIISALAGIYVDVVSPLGPRIQVTGSPAILQNPQVQAKVRATLLAGIRAAVLWQQVGGSRLQLMFSVIVCSNRRKISLLIVNRSQELLPMELSSLTAVSR